MILALAALSTSAASALALPLHDFVVAGQPERYVVWGLTYRFVERFFDLMPGATLRPR